MKVHLEDIGLRLYRKSGQSSGKMVSEQDSDTLGTFKGFKVQSTEVS